MALGRQNLLAEPRRGLIAGFGRLRGLELQARSSIEPVSVTAQCCKRGRIAPVQK